MLGSGAGCDAASLPAMVPRLGMAPRGEDGWSSSSWVRSRSSVARRPVWLSLRIQAIEQTSLNHARGARSLSLRPSRIGRGQAGELEHEAWWVGAERAPERLCDLVRGHG